VRGGVVDGVNLDDNTRANQAIKRAVGVNSDDIKGFEACHLWPRTAYDARSTGPLRPHETYVQHGCRKPLTIRNCGVKKWRRRESNPRRAVRNPQQNRALTLQPLGMIRSR
jgi:hypothetical protein